MNCIWKEKGKKVILGGVGLLLNKDQGTQGILQNRVESKGVE